MSTNREENLLITTSLILEKFDLNMLIALNSAIMLNKKIDKNNLSYEKAYQFNLIDIDGNPFNIEILKKVLSFEINKKSTKKKNKSKSFKRAVLNVIKKYQPSYHQLGNILKEIRVEIENEPWYQKPKSNRKIPIMPNTDQLKAFFAAFDSMKDPQYKLWARLVYDSQVRVDELVHILIKEVNLIDRKILIHGKGNNGKGKKDRMVLISPEIAELLKLHIKSNPDNLFLFENKKRKPYTARRVEQVFMDARIQAGIEIQMNPHLGRHIGLTNLTKNGFVAIMDQSGHASPESLKIYQHLSIDQFQPQFDEAMKSFWNQVL